MAFTAREKSVLPCYLCFASDKNKPRWERRIRNKADFISFHYAD